jgi:hypothetical protein
MRDDPDFVGRGLTAGGAREWAIPNVPIGTLGIQILSIRKLVD